MHLSNAAKSCRFPDRKLFRKPAYPTDRSPPNVVFPLIYNNLAETISLTQDAWVERIHAWEDAIFGPTIHNGRAFLYE